VAGDWKQLRGTVREKWGQLTDDDVGQIAFRCDKLAGTLQERLGYERDRAGREADGIARTW